MRVRYKEITDQGTIAGLLDASHVGRLGTVGDDGFPMIKPLNFVYSEGKVYFHSAQEGEKIDSIKRDGRVCFEIDFPLAYVGSRGVPCKADYLYRSVIIKGLASLVANEEEKLTVLRSLMKKYQPQGGYGDFPEDKVALTAIVRIDIEEMTGKEDLGKEDEREAVMAFLEPTDHVGTLERG